MFNKIKMKLQGIYNLTLIKNNKIIVGYNFHNEIQSDVFSNLAKLVGGVSYSSNELKLQDLIISSAETIEDYETGSFSQFRTSIATQRIIENNTITSNYQIDDDEGQILIKSLILLNANNNIYSFVKLSEAIDKRTSNDYGSYILTINRKDIFANE